MKLIIDIPDEYYEQIMDHTEGTTAESEAVNAIRNGTSYEESSQGEWIFQYRFLDDNLYKCSNCGRLISIYYKGVLSDYKFCQECGASMKGGVENR